MRAAAPLLTIFAALCIVAAGCSGGTGSLPYAGTNAASDAALPAGSSDTVAVAADSLSSNAACRVASCQAHLVAPLKLSGSRLIVVAGSCKRVAVTSAKEYTAPQTGNFMLGGTVSMKADCSALRVPNTELRIAAAPYVRARGKAKAPPPKFVLLSSPEGWTSRAWVFKPEGSGIAMRARAKYIFFVVAVPKTATPPPSPSPGPVGQFVLLQPLSFDGTNFSVVPNACFHGDPHDAPPYVAPTSAPLTLSSPVPVTPTCVPSPLPSISPLPQLYIVAVDLTNINYGRPHAQRANAHSLNPHEWIWGTPAVAVAGGVNLTDSTWNFAPDYPGLTMTGGTSYAFFIAAPLATPPTPSPTPQPTATPQPTQPYQELVPLSFDGTNFTVPYIYDCTQLPHVAPYTAPTSGPLTLSGSVTVTPVCTPSPYYYGYYNRPHTYGTPSPYPSGYPSPYPSPYPSGYPSPYPTASAAPLYIVAVPCNDNGGGYGGGGYGNDAKPSHDHHHHCGNNGWGGGDNAKPHDGGWGNCNNGWYGGGHAKPHDSDDDGCQIQGIAIAGPVNLTDNPWNFAPLTPGLTMTAGAQYDFYIAQPPGNNWGGGDGGDTLHHHNR